MEIRMEPEGRPMEEEQSPAQPELHPAEPQLSSPQRELSPAETQAELEQTLRDLDPPKPAAPADARPRVLYPFFLAWLLYGAALMARLFSTSVDFWEAVQRYSFMAALGFVARYKNTGFAAWIPVTLAILAIGAVIIEARDPVLAAKLTVAFVAALGLGQLLRGK